MKKRYFLIPLIVLGVMFVITSFTLRVKMASDSSFHDEEFVEEENSNVDRAILNNRATTTASQTSFQYFLYINEDIKNNSSTSDILLLGTTYSSTYYNIMKINNNIIYVSDTIRATPNYSFNYSTTNLNIGDSLVYQFYYVQNGTSYDWIINLYKYTYDSSSNTWNNSLLYTTTKTTTSTFTAYITYNPSVYSKVIGGTQSTISTDNLIKSGDIINHINNDSSLYVDDNSKNYYFIKELSKFYTQEGDYLLATFRLVNGDEINLYFVCTVSNERSISYDYGLALDYVSGNTTNSELISYSKTNYITATYDGTFLNINVINIGFVRESDITYISYDDIKDWDSSLGTSDLNGINNSIALESISFSNAYVSQFTDSSSLSSNQIVIDVIGENMLNIANEGYFLGFNDGMVGYNGIKPAFEIISSVFSGLGEILSIQLAPGISIGMFLLVPLFFGLIGFIIWIWRRN